MPILFNYQVLIEKKTKRGLGITLKTVALYNIKFGHSVYKMGEKSNIFIANT